MSTLPTLTDEQRRHNLELAMKVRKERAELKRQLKAGQVSLVEALDDECAQRMYVRQLLAALPNIGPKRANVAMARVFIPANRHVQSLGSRERERLIKYFDKSDQ